MATVHPSLILLIAIDYDCLFFVDARLQRLLFLALDDVQRPLNAILDQALRDVRREEVLRFLKPLLGILVVVGLEVDHAALEASLWCQVLLGQFRVAGSYRE